MTRFLSFLKENNPGGSSDSDRSVRVEHRFTPLESPAACSGDEDIIPFRANTGFNAPLALLETFSNGVNEPPRWKVKDFLTGFTCCSILLRHLEEVNDGGKNHRLR
jgi:hypothetical protein